MAAIYKKPVILILVLTTAIFPTYSSLPNLLRRLSDLPATATNAPQRAGENRNTTIRYQYDDKSRLLTTKHEITQEQVRFTYDAIGRVTARETGSRERQEFVWDTQGRLAEIRFSDGTHTSYKYDPLGRMSRRTDRQGKTTKFVYDGLKLIQERKEDDSILASYVYAENLERPVLMVENDRVYLFIYDRLGSVVALADATGKSSSEDQPNANVVARYRYDAWGNILQETATVNQPFRFASYFYEPDAKLYYLANRWYSPSIGRFLSPDPILPTSVAPQEWNAYAYAKNDPVNRIDPMGLQSELSLSQGYSPWNLLKSSLNHLPDTLVKNFRKDPGTGSGVGVEAELASNSRSSLLPGILSANVSSYIEGWDTSNQEAANVMFSPLLSNIPGVGQALTTESSLALAGIDSLPRQFKNAFVYANQVAIPEVYGVPGTENLLAFGLNTNSVEQLSKSVNFQLESLFGYANSIPAIPYIYAKNDFQKPGGILLNQSDQALAKLTQVHGAVWDDKNKQLIIVGKTNQKSNSNQAKLNLNDLLVAINVLYSGKEIGVSIDPRKPSNGEERSDKMNVRYIPKETNNTNLGRILFEADRQLKVLNLGKNNDPNNPIDLTKLAQKIKDYRSELDLIPSEQVIDKPSVWSRFWFQPEPLSLSTTERAFVYDETNKLKIKTQYFEPGPPPKSIEGNDPTAQKFVDQINNNYDKYAQEITVFDELRQVAQLVGLTKWLRKEAIPVDRAWLDEQKLQPIKTSDTTPAITAWKRTEKPSSDSIPTWLVIGAYGGVNLAPEPIVKEDPQIGQFRENVLKSRPAEGKVSWDVQNYLKAVAISLSTSPTAGGIQWTDVDIPGGQNFSLGFARYFDSLHQEWGAFGPSWSLEPYSLEFPKSYAQVTSKKEKWQPEIVLRDRHTGTSQTFDLGRNVDSSLGYKFQQSITDLTLQKKVDGYFVKSNNLELKFDLEGRIQKVKQANRSENNYTWNKERLSSISLANKGTVKLIYDNNGRIAKAEDGIGRTVYYSYDQRGRLQEVRNAQQQPITIYTYSPSGRLTQVKDANGGIKFEGEYDEMGRVVSFKRQGLNFIYRDNSVEIRRKGEFIGKVRYDSLGKVSAVEGPNGPIWSTEQTSEKVTQIKTADSSLSLEVQKNDQGEEIKHSTMGTLLSVIRDSKNRPVSVTDQFGATTQLEYNENNRLSRITNAYQGHTIDASYDERGRLVSLEDPDGVMLHFDSGSNSSANSIRLGNSSPMTIKRDSLGRPIEITAPSRETTKLKWDEQDRLVGLETPFMHFDLEVDKQGRIKLSNGKDNALRYSFDKYGNVQEVQDGKGAKLKLERDATGKLTQIVSPDGRIINFRWDKSERLTEIHDNQSRSKKIQRDNLGRVSRVESGDEWLELNYDPLGRITSLKHSSGLETGIEYNARQRITRIKNADGAVSFENDLAGRRIRTQDAEGHTIQVRYTPGSREERVGYPSEPGFLRNIRDHFIGSSGLQVFYNYDARGLVKSITLNQKNNVVVEFKHDADGRITQIKSKGTTINREYASSFLPSQIQATSADGKVLHEVRYEYDQSGRCVRESGTNGDRFYKYDEAGRLQESQLVNQYKEIYRYDLGGNRELIRLNNPDITRRIWKKTINLYAQDIKGNKS